MSRTKPGHALTSLTGMYPRSSFGMEEVDRNSVLGTTPTPSTATSASIVSPELRLT